MTKARLVFEDGTLFEGIAFASVGERFGEVVFNTAMSGYQEVLTDPSYYRQMVVMTYPLMGNYGINAEDVESSGLFLSALIVKEYIDFPSNFRSNQSLKAYLEANNILGVEDIDTRALTRYIRESGAQKAILTTGDEPLHELVEKVLASSGMVGADLVGDVTCKAAYKWEGPESTFKVAVIDCGIKLNILRLLAKADCECTVFPSTVTADEILAGNFHGVFLSNGPGDPAAVVSVIETVKSLLGKLPIFGICLGHQIMGLALGAQTFKLKFGHHGANHPVKDFRTGKIEITSQNHGFSVDPETLGEDVEITHLNLNDDTIEGIRHTKYPAFSVQYHPEAAPGPHDSRYLFDEFTSLMRGFHKL